MAARTTALRQTRWAWRACGRSRSAFGRDDAYVAKLAWSAPGTSAANARMPHGCPDAARCPEALPCSAVRPGEVKGACRARGSKGATTASATSRAAALCGATAPIMRGWRQSESGAARARAMLSHAAGGCTSRRPAIVLAAARRDVLVSYTACGTQSRGLTRDALSHESTQGPAGGRDGASEARQRPCRAGPWPGAWIGQCNGLRCARERKCRRLVMRAARAQNTPQL